MDKWELQTEGPLPSLLLASQSWDSLPYFSSVPGPASVAITETTLMVPTLVSHLGGDNCFRVQYLIESF